MSGTVVNLIRKQRRGRRTQISSCGRLGAILPWVTAPAAIGLSLVQGLIIFAGHLPKKETGFTLSIRIAVTIISTSVHRLNTHSTNHQGALIEIITIPVIGHSGWFAIMSRSIDRSPYADEVATGIGWPLDRGFQLELGSSSTGIGLAGFHSST